MSGNWFNELVHQTNLEDFNVPYSWDEILFLAVSGAIAIFEIVFNLMFDHPITLHSKNQTSLMMLAISGAFNSIPHIILGCLGLKYLTESYQSSALLLMTKYKQSQEISTLKSNKDPRGNPCNDGKESIHEKVGTLHRKHEAELKSICKIQKGGLRFCLYLMYCSLFLWMQMYFWWLPYLFGLVTSTRFNRMHRKLDGVYSIFPQNDHYLVPSLEHTILFPMTVCSCILTVRLFVKYRPVLINQIVASRWNYVLCWICTVVTCYFPIVMATIVIPKEIDRNELNEENIGRKQENEYDIGAMITAASLISINMAFYLVLFWSPFYKRANKKNAKKQH